jgi:hypothetical protein
MFVSRRCRFVLALLINTNFPGAADRYAVGLERDVVPLWRTAQVVDRRGELEAGSDSVGRVWTRSQRVPALRLARVSVWVSVSDKGVWRPLRSRSWSTRFRLFNLLFAL